MTQLSSRPSATNYNPTACLMACSYLHLNSSKEARVQAAQRGSLQTERGVRQRVARVWLRRGEVRGDEWGWAAGACWPRPSPGAERFRRGSGRYEDQSQTVPLARVPGEAAWGKARFISNGQGTATGRQLGPLRNGGKVGAPGPEGTGR
ncbi:uncharacterized protein LOC113220386 [Piliocolobus tephrosceles]|uniref:uncharacterized protein LOC113220386 n=1 Tax=Piliocolobus tephrosceles TaxID=591936 RepID=UPI0013014CE4|nr:uncharacterized protein LOC113220386 [Piliocolobus tephrosceles]